MNALTYLGEEYAELFERLEQTGISNLLDDKDTFWWLVPRQSLAGGVLNVPEHGNIISNLKNRLKSHMTRKDKTKKEEKDLLFVLKGKKKDIIMTKLTRSRNILTAHG